VSDRVGCRIWTDWKPRLLSPCLTLVLVSHCPVLPGCGGPAPTSDATGADPLVQTAALDVEPAATGSANEGRLIAPSAGRAAALPMRAEAWPRRLSGEPDAVAAPATLDLAFESSPDARFPWVFVIGLPGGPHQVAAIALFGVDDPRLIRDFTVLVFTGEIVLDRAVWAQFLEMSERAGSATLQRQPGWQLFVLPSSADASFVSLRALSNHGGDTTGLGAVRLLDAQMLDAFRAGHPDVAAVNLTVAGPSGAMDGLIMPTPGEEGSGSPPFGFPETGIDVFDSETD
jgi:hypothetical protein